MLVRRQAKFKALLRSSRLTALLSRIREKRISSRRSKRERKLSSWLSLKTRRRSFRSSRKNRRSRTKDRRFLTTIEQESNPEADLQTRGKEPVRLKMTPSLKKSKWMMTPTEMKAAPSKSMLLMIIVAMMILITRGMMLMMRISDHSRIKCQSRRVDN